MQGDATVTTMTDAQSAPEETAFEFADGTRAVWSHAAHEWYAIGDGIALTFIRFMVTYDAELIEPHLEVIRSYEDLENYTGVRFGEPYR